MTGGHGLARVTTGGRRPAAIALAVGLVAAACGGGGTSVDEFRQAAAAVCEEVQREADALALPTAGPALAQSLRASAELGRDEVEALVALDRPDEQGDEVDAWLDALGRRVTALEAYAGAVAQTPPGEPVPSVPDDLGAATQEAAEGAVALDLAACGAGVDTPIGAAGEPQPGAVPGGPAPGPVDTDGATTTITNDAGIPPDETTTQDQ